MTRPVHSNALHLSVTAPASLALKERLRGHFVSLQKAWAGQACLTALAPETLSDTGLSPEELTGAPSYDPALPFFMQASFGRHDR